MRPGSEKSSVKNEAFGSFAVASGVQYRQGEGERAAPRRVRVKSRPYAFVATFCE